MKNIKRFRQNWLAVSLGVIAVLAVSAVSAQPKYPDRPIRVIVPFPPGGINDVVARPLLQKLSELLQASMVIENRAGAGGTIGATAAARAEGDGYTLFLGAASTMAVAPALRAVIQPSIPEEAHGMDFSADVTIRKFARQRLRKPSISRPAAKVPYAARSLGALPLLSNSASTRGLAVAKNSVSAMMAR